MIELIGHVNVRARVPSDAHWTAASDYIRANFDEDDTIGVAPAWADPTLRYHLGDLIPLSHAARSDLASADRFWVVSLRGQISRYTPHRDGEPVTPDHIERFGPVSVLRYDLGASPVIFDLTSHVDEATVSITENDEEKPCRWSVARERGRGGLSTNTILPKGRFRCDPRRDWLAVAETAIEDLDLQPRHCVWQHPPNRDGLVRTVYEDVPLGERIVLYTGIYYEHERTRERPPYSVRVLVDGSEVGRLDHEDGDGWARIELPTQLHGTRKERGDIAVEVFAEVNPHFKSACWSATVRGPRREVGE